MIKQTFKTLKQHPTIWIGFLAIMLITTLATIPYLVFYFNNIDTFIYVDQQNYTEMIALYAKMMSYVGIMSLVSLGVIFVGLPPVLSYVKEAVLGENTEGWYKRGLKKNWWKPFVLMLIAYVAIIPVAIIFTIIMMIPFIGILGLLLYIVVILTWSIFLIIGMTAVVAEDNFGDAIGKTFKIGWKYFFKQLGTTMLAMIPIIIIELGYFVFLAVEIINISPYIDRFDSFSDILSPELTVVSLILYVVLIIYSVFSGSYLYTYSMHQYVEEKRKMTVYQKPPVQEQPPVLSE